MHNYIVCRHETAGEVVYGMTLMPQADILHISRDELIRRVSQGLTGVFFTAANGKHGAQISAVEGHLVVNHVRTQSNRRYFGQPWRSLCVRLRPRPQ
jgi:hypothetical protein